MDVTLRFLPAKAGTGIVFRRTDVPGQTEISANVLSRNDVPRRTLLVKGTDCVDMVEHVMAALVGLEIDNCVVEIDGPEVPGLDGSSIGFLEALQRVGTVVQVQDKPCLFVEKEIIVRSGDSYIRAVPNPKGRFEINYHLQYKHEAIGQQTFHYIHSIEDFSEQLAPARTFLLEEEAQTLKKLGIGLRVSNLDVLVFGPNGPIGNVLRYGDECVRHKTLDVLGDLALSGHDIVGTFYANRSGHRLNAQMVQLLLAECEAKENSIRRIA